MVKRVSKIIPKRVMEAWDANVNMLFPDNFSNMSV